MEYSYEGYIIKIIEYSPGICTNGYDVYVNGKHLTFQGSIKESKQRAESYIQSIKNEVKPCESLD